MIEQEIWRWLVGDGMDRDCGNSAEHHENNIPVKQYELVKAEKTPISWEFS